MAIVTVNQGESIESALRRFKRKVMTEEIIKDAKKHAFFIPPGQKAKLKSALARKRNKKKGRMRTCPPRLVVKSPPATGTRAYLTSRLSKSSIEVGRSRVIEPDGCRASEASAESEFRMTRILLTNDDGIHSDGSIKLERR